MNTITLANKRDLPLTTDLLKAMQDAYSQLEALAAVVVPNQVAILSGCTDRGNSVDDGMMIWQGKVVPFKGAAKQNMVRLVQTVITHQVGNGSYDHTTWHAEFGVSPEGRHIPWSVVQGYSWKCLQALSQDLFALTMTNGAQYSAHTNDIAQLRSDVKVWDGMLSDRVTATEVRNTEQDTQITLLAAWNQDRVAEISQLRNDATSGDATLSARVTATEVRNAEQDSRLSALESENGNRYNEIQSVSAFAHSASAAANLEIADIKTKNSTQDTQINQLLDATAYIPQVLFTGNVKKTGSLENLRVHPHIMTNHGIVAQRVREGGYRISWSTTNDKLQLGTRHDYMVIVNTDGQVLPNIGVRAIYKQPTYFEVTFADDTTLNDTSFDFMVISQIYNP